MNNIDLKISIENSDKWKIVESLYLKSFPANERQSIEKIIDRIEKGKIELIIVYHQDEAIGFALIWRVKNLKSIYLEYIAVEEDYQNRGIGKELIKFLMNQLVPSEKIIAEIEDFLLGENKQQRLSRYLFYKNLGFEKIDRVDYFLPPLDGTIPTKMDLIIFPTQDHLPREYVKSVIKLLFEEVYEKSENNFYYCKVLKSIK
jgi:ribosomal protein S18 acetylase RimI-like enzyme